ncbi:neural cell adhesion molecule L1 [Elysia marginata]|uniref:Neural cell adhesion molecule L1 n=1 Tax=Elysia marginata TaxID=1093978 RepID=A0AAV4F0P5_9GAST|nr:neural cell adhesion molecule L1 [Elysia marginata]
MNILAPLFSNNNAYTLIAIFPLDVEEVKVKKWQKLNIPCGKTPDAIAVNKRWYFEKIIQVQTNERVGVDLSGTLRFAYTELGDAKTYYCGLGNFLGIQLYNPRDVQVLDVSDTGDSAPLAEYITKDAKAIIGRTLYLECYFSGKPVPKITWKNSTNHDIPLGHPRFIIEESGHLLKIESVRQEDEGTFRCKAENTLDVKEEYIKVNVTTPPVRTTGSLRTYTKPDQEDFVLPCKAKAAIGELIDPPVWYRNGERLTANNVPDAERYSFSEDNTELTIRQLVKEVDTASYQCSVTNSEGELYMNGYLRVISSIHVSSRPSDTIRVSHNSSEVYDLSILPTGDHCCRISVLYYFNGTQLTENVLHKPPFRKNDSTGMVSFVPSSVSEEDLVDWLGEYTCKVYNNYQEKYVKFTLVSKETTPEAIVATSESTGLWWIGILAGVLVILIVIIIVIVVYKSNYPGETYQLEKTELKHHLNPEEDLLNQSFQEI